MGGRVLVASSMSRRGVRDGGERWSSLWVLGGRGSRSEAAFGGWPCGYVEKRRVAVVVVSEMGLSWC